MDHENLKVQFSNYYLKLFLVRFTIISKNSQRLKMREGQESKFSRSNNLVHKNKKVWLEDLYG